jgi:hypothetical protein
MERWARDAMPWEKTVYGEFPRLAATSIASPVPNSHRPKTSDAACNGRGNHLFIVMRSVRV